MSQVLSIEELTERYPGAVAELMEQGAAGGRSRLMGIMSVAAELLPGPEPISERRGLNQRVTL